MPFESMVGSAFVVAVFALFAAALAWGDWSSRQARKQLPRR
jgi:hypothetical protein